MIQLFSSEAPYNLIIIADVFFPSVSFLLLINSCFISSWCLLFISVLFEYLIHIHSDLQRIFLRYLIHFVVLCYSFLLLFEFFCVWVIFIRWINFHFLFSILADYLHLYASIGLVDWVWGCKIPSIRAPSQDSKVCFFIKWIFLEGIHKIILIIIIFFYL